ncbi:MAG: YraN family protein [Proteobacteria bacterium]|nr:YraN family protein [Pseudomonadota bacterium]
MNNGRARHRRDLGVFGETLAATFLIRQGLTVIARNVFVDGDELDLIVLDGVHRVAVEVKTTSNGDDPMEAIDRVKRYRIRRAVNGYEPSVKRIDTIGVRLTPFGVDIQWVRDAM